MSKHFSREHGICYDEMAAREWYKLVQREGIRLQLRGVKLRGAPEWNHSAEGIVVHNKTVAIQLGMNPDLPYGLPVIFEERNVTLCTLLRQLNDAGYVPTTVHVRGKAQGNGEPLWVTTVGFFKSGREVELAEEAIDHFREIQNRVFGSADVWLNPKPPKDFDPATDTRPLIEVVPYRIDDIVLGQPRNPAKLKGARIRELRLTRDSYVIM